MRIGFVPHENIRHFNHSVRDVRMQVKTCSNGDIRAHDLANLRQNRAFGVFFFAADHGAVQRQKNAIQWQGILYAFGNVCQRLLKERFLDMATRPTFGSQCRYRVKARFLQNPDPARQRGFLAFDVRQYRIAFQQSLAFKIFAPLNTK